MGFATGSLGRERVVGLNSNSNSNLEMRAANVRGLSASKLKKFSWDLSEGGLSTAAVPATQSR